MQDQQIIELFFERDERAIGACRESYGSYLYKVAYNILGDRLDCEEAVSDSLLGAWNSIPPQRPDSLKAYLVRLCRRTAIDVWRTKTREKRRDSEYSVSLDELAEIIPAGGSPATEAELRLLGDAVGRWAAEQSEEQRSIFVLRYYYSEPVRSISKRLGISESKTKSALYRMRNSLRAFLEKEEIL